MDDGPCKYHNFDHDLVGHCRDLNGNDFAEKKTRFVEFFINISRFFINYLTSNNILFILELLDASLIEMQVMQEANDSIFFNIKALRSRLLYFSIRKRVKLEILGLIKFAKHTIFL